MANTDHTPLPLKLENALVAYLDSILVSAGLTGLQVLPAHNDTEELESPRCVVMCESLSAVSLDLPGVFDCTVNVEYLTQHGTTQRAAHLTAAAKLVSWLADLSTVKTYLNTVDALHCYNYQFAQQSFETSADDGTHTSRVVLLIRAQGRAF